MGQTNKKLQKPNPYLNASSTGLVRNNTTRSTLVPSTPSTPTFPPSIYNSSPLSYVSSTSISKTSIPRAVTPTPTPVSPISPLSQRELNRLSDIIDPLEVMNEHFPPVPVTPPNSSVQTPSGSTAVLDENGSHNSTAPSQPPHPRYVPLGNKAIVQSPSGNTFGVHEFVRHTDRPLAMWERQARIISATQEKIQALEEKRSISRIALRRGESRMTLRQEERTIDALELETKPRKTSKLRHCCSMIGLFR